MTTKQLFTFILFLTLFAAAVRVPRDPDMWWHLRTGEYVIENGIPTEDPGFAFTTTSEQPWFMHEWLSEVLMYGIYQVGDLWALSIFFAAVVTATYMLMYYCSAGRPYLAAFVTLLGFSTSMAHVNARPQMFNILFAAAIVFLLERTQDGRLSRRWWWSIPIMMLVWANLHSGFLLGIAVMGVYLVGGGMQQIYPGAGRRDFSWSDLRFLLLIIVVSVGAALINPNGFHLLTYPFATLSDSAMQEYLSEWQSPDFHIWFFWIFGMMFIGGFVAMALSKRTPTWTELLMYVGTGAAGLQSVRHIPIFGVVVIPIICRHLISASEGTRFYPWLSGNRAEEKVTPFAYRFNLFLAAILAIGALVYAAVSIRNIDEQLEQYYPVAAVRYLRLSGREQAPIYNEYAWGGYLIYEEIPTFIDGRADLFGTEFIEYYQDTYAVEENWQAALNDYQIEYVLIPPEINLAVLLTTSPEWQRIYEDEVAHIYARQSE